MKSGLGITIATRAYKPLKTRSKQVASNKRDTLLGARTHPLDGHPVLEFEDGVSASDIYPLTEFSYRDQQPMEIKIVDFLPIVKSDIDEVDWDRVNNEKGVSSYSITELTAIARRLKLHVPSKFNKPDIVELLWDYKEEREGR